MPGLPKAPGGLAPPVPGNRARSNSDQGSRDAPAAPMDAAPQLAGLFAGGMPKLRKTGGGVDTGGTLRPMVTLTSRHLTHSSGPSLIIPIRPRVLEIIRAETTNCLCSSTACRRCSCSPWTSNDTGPGQPCIDSESQKDSCQRTAHLVSFIEGPASSNRQEAPSAAQLP